MFLSNSLFNAVLIYITCHCHEIISDVNQKWRASKDYDVFYTSEDPKNPNNVIQFYVFPILRHGPALMAKGKVYVGRRSSHPH